MNRAANVSSIEAIRAFRPTLIKFAEEVRQALAEVQGEVQRTVAWLETEQGPFWQRQIRKCQEEVQQAKLALNQKRLYKTPTGGRQTAVDEERALKRAKRRLEIAEQKVQAVKRWRRDLEREWARQQGLLQRLGQNAEHDVPQAVALLERMSRSLEAYVALAVPSTRPQGSVDADQPASMATQPVEEQSPDPPPEEDSADRDESNEPPPDPDHPDGRGP